MPRARPSFWDAIIPLVVLIGLIGGAVTAFGMATDADTVTSALIPENS